MSPGLSYFTSATHPPPRLCQPVLSQKSRQNKRNEEEKGWNKGGGGAIEEAFSSASFDVLAKTGLQRDLIANELIK